MHELSIAISIIEVAEEEGRRHGGLVRAVHLRLGPLAGVVPEALASAFELAREGTPLSEADLVIEPVEVIAFCPKCETERTLGSIQEMFCPECGEPTPNVLQGREMEVVALEITT